MNTRLSKYPSNNAGRLPPGDDPVPVGLWLLSALAIIGAIYLFMR